MYVIYFPVHCAGVTNMSPRYNLSRCEDMSLTSAYKI